MVTLSWIIPLVILLVFIILQLVNSLSRAHALHISSSLESTTYQEMPLKAGKLSRKRGTFEGHRSTIKRIAYEVNKHLDALTIDVNLDDRVQTSANTACVEALPAKGISAHQIGNSEGFKRRNPVKCGGGGN